MNPYTRSAIIDTSSGVLIGSQGYSLWGAVVISVVAGFAISGARQVAPGVIPDSVPMEGRHPFAISVALAIAGWWIGSRFFPPPRRGPYGAV